MIKNTSHDPIVISVSLSSGGIPKLPQSEVHITFEGVYSDGRNHTKHNLRSRALSLFDEEIMLQLCKQGYRITPGAIGENITLRNVRIQEMQPGTLLKLGDIIIRLEEPRKPCYVLDAIDEQLKDDIVGRCGYLASVIKGGTLTSGTTVTKLETQKGLSQLSQR